MEKKYVFMIFLCCVFLFTFRGKTLRDRGIKSNGESVILTRVLCFFFLCVFGLVPVEGVRPLRSVRMKPLNN